MTDITGAGTGGPRDSSDDVLAASSKGPALRALQQLTVLGMFRSGTSTMAQALSDAGAWAGEPVALVPPDANNPGGYFERLGTREVLDGLLEQLGGSWSAPPLRSLNRLDLDPFRHPLRQLFKEVSEGVPDGRVPLLKDPRLSLFASELPTILGSTDGVIICVRHPLSVARSLQDVWQIPLTTGLSLWEIYNAAICKGLAGRAVRVFSFSDAQDRGQLQAFAYGSLAAGGVAHEGEPELLSRRFGHDQRLRRSDAEDEREWLSAAQVELWQALAEAARSPQPTVLEAVDASALAAHEMALTGRTAAARDLALHVQALEAECVELRQGQQAANAHVRELQQRLAEAGDEQRRLLTQVDDDRQQRQTIDRLHSALQQEHHSATVQLEALAVERGSLVAQLDATAAERLSLAKRIELLLTENLEIDGRARLAEQGWSAELAAAEHLRHSLEQAHADVGRLANEVSERESVDRAHSEEVARLHDALAHAQAEVTQLEAALERDRTAAREQKLEDQAIAEDLRSSLADAGRRTDLALTELDDAITAWLEADDSASTWRLQHETLLESRVTSDRRLLADLDRYRGFYEEVTTAWERCVPGSVTPTYADLQEWLENLHVVSPGHETEVRLEAAPDEATRARLEQDLHIVMLEVDALRGFVEEVQSLWLAEFTGHAPLDRADLSAWVAQLHSRATRSSSSWAVGEAALVSAASREHLLHLEEEAAALRRHRDAVVSAHLSVMSSQSWRLGKALTWPVRVFRRPDRELEELLKPPPEQP